MHSLLKDSFDLYEEEVDKYYAELFFEPGHEESLEERYNKEKGN